MNNFYYSHNIIFYSKIPFNSIDICYTEYPGLGYVFLCICVFYVLEILKEVPPQYVYFRESLLPFPNTVLYGPGSVGVIVGIH